MTEVEWHDPSREVRELLEHLEQSGGGTERKFRLFACACCRRPWDQQGRSDLDGQALLCAALALIEADLGEAPPTEEQYDRLCDELGACTGYGQDARELGLGRLAWDGDFAANVRGLAGQLARGFVRSLESRLAGLKEYYWSKDEPEWGDIADAQLATARALARIDDLDRGWDVAPVSEAARLAQEAARSLAGVPYGLHFGEYWPPVGPEPSVVAVAEAAMSEARRQEAVAQAALLRDVIGNPFRPPAIDPAWLTSDVVALAGSIFDERDFAAMPILADALRDAGCEDEDLLAHCRCEGPHIRGCWVLDLVLGRK
jgi:hypothetical protein